MNQIQIPEKFAPFLEPHRYKTAYGGRGGAKSHTIGGLLVHIAARQPEFIVCGREFQNSIEDSVYRLLENTIKKDGLTDYKFTKTSIENTRTGSEFVFKGLSKLDGVSIKSLEGATKLWIEEGQNITNGTLNNVIPTIRTEGSEIWTSFNPSVIEAPVWQRLVVKPPPDSVVVKVNHNDNPWFPKVLEEERRHHFVTMDRATYDNIWEGVPMAFTAGAIFREEMAAMEKQGRIGKVPHDPTKPVIAVFDMGHAASGKGDPHAITFVQQGNGTAVNAIGYWEGNNKPLPTVVQEELIGRPYTISKVVMPHDANRTNSHTGKTDVEIVEGFGFTVEMLERTNDLDRDVNNLRTVLPLMFIDEENCQGLLACLRNHRREKDEKTGLWRFKHDWTSHGVSSARYLAVYYNIHGGLGYYESVDDERRSAW
ncbi:phage terminase, large subunit, PBSX family [Rhizobium leguminosarum bv. trifolii WSM2304]|uniref:Phage terminase, large subunit, PBSX family n=1 Tax=Rhizobium leguminosarum bv. trifolii (strain WSM2304) TaxID=395492 RepID=A0ABF7QKG8_RHILW|nr:PBSX family phage terminase large subunit [Rhizobium leguminosarum]ACI54437.1 phage terminase, large subunit, PBSX family [Rhizobium leguminosarum bv. trifolii WSM2304]